MTETERADTDRRLAAQTHDDRVRASLLHAAALHRQAVGFYEHSAQRLAEILQQQLSEHDAGS